MAASESRHLAGVAGRDIANRTFVSATVGRRMPKSRTCRRRRTMVAARRAGTASWVARPRSAGFFIGERRIDPGSPVFVIAEIGINHNGSLDVAKRLIDVAAEAEADSAKFQIRDLGSLYRNAAGGDRREDLGPQYTLDLLDRFSLGVASARGLRLHPLRRSRATVQPLGPGGAGRWTTMGCLASRSPQRTSPITSFLRSLADLGKPIVMLPGSTEQEIVETWALRSAGASYALLHCNSTYPAPFRDVNLRYMDRLAELGDCIVGYSGHEQGYHVPIAAVARGEKMVEKRITLDRGWEGMATRSVCFRTNSRRWSARSVISKRRWAPARTFGSLGPR